MLFVAFFRGINVGGRNIVKMAELKQLFIDGGFLNVRTHIQSGNVLFEYDKPVNTLPEEIEEAFLHRFGFASAVILRSKEELSAIVHAAPFPGELVENAHKAFPDTEHLYVYLSGSQLDRDRIDQLTGKYSGPDRLYLTQREVFLFCFESVRNSKLAAALNKPGLVLTARNFGVLSRLLELMDEGIPSNA